MIDRKLTAGPFFHSVNIYAAPRTLRVGDAAGAQQIVGVLQQSGYTTAARNPMGRYNLRPNDLEIFPGPESYFGPEAAVLFTGGRLTKTWMPVETPIVYAQSFPDTRWPTLASRPADLGAHSAASYRLAAASVASAGTGGSLNTYGIEPDAFSDEAQQIGLILAAHASMAAGAVRERDALQDVAEQPAPGPVDPRCHRPGQGDPDGAAQAHPGGRLRHPASRHPIG